MSPDVHRMKVGAAEASLTNVRLLELDGRDSMDAIVDRIRSAAYAEGVVAGKKAAIGGAASLLAEAAASVETQRLAAVDGLAHSAVTLAVEIARQLIRKEVAAGNHELEAIVRETLGAASADRSRCVVHVHPDDLAALDGAQFRSGTSVEADIGVERGDVHVETSMGLMVREVEGALDEIAERIRGDLE